MGDFWRRNKFYLGSALVISILAGGALIYINRGETSAPAMVLASPGPPVKERDNQIVVDVEGAVVKPGLYRLKSGSRVEDALQLAGGLLSDADLRGINRAATLKDGTKLYVPRQGESFSGQAAGPEPGKLNINQATMDELDRLSGIGPVTAQRIIDYRKKNGPFNSIEELQEKKLVKPSVFQQIKDQLTV